MLGVRLSCLLSSPVVPRLLLIFQILLHSNLCGGNHCRCDTCFHTMSAQLINRIADLERFREVSAVPMLFGVPGLWVLSPKPSQVFILYRYSNDIEHLQGFILWTLARFLFSVYYFSFFAYIIFLFLKSSWPLLIEESAKSCLTLSKIYVTVLLRIVAVVYVLYCFLFSWYTDKSLIARVVNDCFAIISDIIHCVSHFLNILYVFW